MYETARLLISAGNLQHNYNVFYRHCGRVMAVMKCNAYGLGAPQVSEILYQTGCRDFLVATVTEGITLRLSLQKDAKIYIANSILNNMIAVCKEYDLLPVCADRDVALMCEQAGLDYWLHVETGLNRLGVSKKDLEDLNFQGLITQLISANEPVNPLTIMQVEIMEELKNIHANHMVTVYNTGGIEAAKTSKFFDMVRIGRGLYGSCEKGFVLAKELKHTVTLQAQVLHIKQVKEGEGIGYGHEFLAPQNMRIGVLGIGYGDGLPAAHPKLLGRIGMDLSVIKVGSEVQVGDWINLIDSQYTVDNLADYLQMNVRQILSGFGSRLCRLFV